MTCSFGNTRVPQSRIIPLVNTEGSVNVGARSVFIAPGEAFTVAADATKVAGDELCSVDNVDAVDVGTPTGTLTIANSDVQDGLVLLAIELSEDAVGGDEWNVQFEIHPDPNQTINATLNVVMSV